MRNSRLVGRKSLGGVLWLGHVGVSVSERCWSRAVALTGLSSATRGPRTGHTEWLPEGHFREHPDLRECELTQGHKPGSECGL